MHLRDRKRASTEEKDRNDCVLASNCPSSKNTIKYLKLRLTTLFWFTLRFFRYYLFRVDVLASVLSGIY